MSVHHTAVVVGTLAIAPLLFIPSFKKLSWLSMAGCVSTVLVTITMVAAVALDPARDRMPVQARAQVPSVRMNNCSSSLVLCRVWRAVRLLGRRCRALPCLHVYQFGRPLLLGA